MTDMVSVSRAFPKITDRGVLEIPRSAWAEIERIAEEEFGATVAIYDYDKPRGHHVARYLFEAKVEVNAVEPFIKRVHPLLEELIERRT
jgi:hypothetical protein